MKSEIIFKWKKDDEIYHKNNNAAYNNAVVFQVNKCDHKKYIEFYYAHFVILAFRFQSHLRTQSDIPNTDSIRHYAHSLLHSHRHDCSTVGIRWWVHYMLAGWLVYSLLFKHARRYIAFRSRVGHHEAFQQKDTKGMEIVYICMLRRSTNISLWLLSSSTFPTSSPFDSVSVWRGCVRLIFDFSFRFWFGICV